MENKEQGQGNPGNVDEMKKKQQQQGGQGQQQGGQGQKQGGQNDVQPDDMNRKPGQTDQGERDDRDKKSA